MFLISLSECGEYCVPFYGRDYLCTPVIIVFVS